MDTLVIILAVVAVPVFLSILAAVFSWRYRHQIEALMRRSVAERGSFAGQNANATAKRCAPVRAPLRLRQVRPGEPAPSCSVSAWRRITLRRRPLAVALITAGAVHTAMSTVAVFWAFAYANWPQNARIVLAYALMAPELVLVLLFMPAPCRLWIAATLAYLIVAVILSPIVGGPLRLIHYLRFAAPWAFFALAGMVLLVSKRLRPVVAAVIALLIFCIVEMLVLARSADISSLQSTMLNRPGLALIGIGVQLMGVVLFAWILGRKSITVTVVGLVIIAASAFLVDRFVKSLGIASAIIVGIAAAVLGCYIVWLLFELLKWLSERHFISNQILQWYVGWGFLTFYTFSLSYFLSPTDRWTVFLALGALVCCVIILQSLLWRYYRHQAAIPAKRLVLLRVFGSPHRAVQLLEMLNDTWRLFGSIDLIVGTDVAALTASPVMLEAFLRRRVEALYLKTTAEVERQLQQLDRRVQGDGRYPINELYCFSSAWQAAVLRLVPGANVVLMDLRGFSIAHLGCVFELNHLVNLASLDRIVLLADRLTDMRALEETLQGAWRNLDSSAPSASAEDPALSVVMLPNLGETARRFLACTLVSAAA